MRELMSYISRRDAVLLALCVGLAAAACRLGAIL